LGGLGDLIAKHNLVNINNKMDLKSLNVEQLKAKIYDSIVVVENHQQFIKLLNKELNERTKQEDKGTVGEGDVKAE
jgi:hypothetical protein